jgi:monoamine oxidase
MPAAVSEPPPPAVDIAIVGAGLAGLVCARRLREGGLAPVVFEAASQLGGRVRTDRTSFGSGVCIELGGELIDSGHERLRGLVTELGLELEDLEAASAGLAPSFVFEGRALSDADLANALRPAIVASARDGRAAFGTDPMAHARRAELDAWSLERWLKERGVGSLGASILSVAYAAETGLDPSELSCLMLLASLGVQRGQIVFYGASDERWHVKGGNDSVVRALAEKAGEPVRVGHALEALKKASDGRYVLTFRRGGGSHDVRAAQVVLALPFTRLREVDLHESLGLPGSKRHAIAELAYGKNTKTILGFSRRGWVSTKQSGELFTDSAVQCAWDSSRAQPGEGGVLTVFRGGKAALQACEGDLPSERARTLAELGKAFPALPPLASGRVVRAPWPTLDIAKGSYSSVKVGQATSFFDVLPKADGGIHYAGEHTSLRFQGFMEGAVESGERAAREVLRATTSRG